MVFLALLLVDTKDILGSHHDSVAKFGNRFMREATEKVCR